MPATRFWADLTWRDFERLDMRATIAVLPIAAVEQHGPHLPAGVDAMLNAGYVARAVEAIPADLPALFLPPQEIGVSLEHTEFPGALTLSAATAMRAWEEIGDSVARAGCRKLVVMNSHGGNNAAIDAALLTLRARWRMLAINASWRRLGYPEGLFSPREAAHGVHAGDAETSLMLALRPETVAREKARDFVNAGEAMEQDFLLLRARPPLGFAWMASDLGETGAVGEANLASAAKGEQALAYGIKRFVALLRDVQEFDLSRLGTGPLGAGSKGK